MKIIDFGILLKEIIDRKGLKHVAIAKDIGVHQSTITKYVNGLNRPPQDMFIKIVERIQPSLPEATELCELVGYPFSSISFLYPPDDQQSRKLIEEWLKKLRTLIDESTTLIVDLGGSEPSERPPHESRQALALLKGEAPKALAEVFDRGAGKPGEALGSLGHPGYWYQFRPLSIRELRPYQLFASHFLGIPVRISVRGIEFWLIPPGKVAKPHSGEILENQFPFYMARTLLSQADWGRLTNAPDEGQNNDAKTNVSIEEVDRMLNGLNDERLAPGEVKIPTIAQWEYVAAAGTRVPTEQTRRSRALGTGMDSELGITDLLGVYWQFCRTKPDPPGRFPYAAVGGDHTSGFVGGMWPSPQVVRGNTQKEPKWGVRLTIEPDLTYQNPAHTIGSK